MVISGSTGRVGINKYNPEAVLEVVGQTGVASTGLIVHGLTQFKTTYNDGSELRHQFAMGGSSDPGSYNIYQGDASTIGVHLNAGGDTYFNGGDVGIGTTSPDTTLDIHGSFTLDGNGSQAQMKLRADDGDGQAIYFTNAASGYEGAITYTNTGTTTEKMDFYVNQGNRMTVLASGNVGIGTTSPGEALEINKSGANLKVVSDNNVYLSLDTTQTNGDEWHIFNANSGATSTLQFKNIDQSKVVMLMDETGKVGIGTTSPTKSTHVNFTSSDTTIATGEGLAGGAAGTGLLIQNSTDSTGVYANLDFRAGSADARIAVQKTNTNAGDMHFIMDNTDSPTSMMVIKNDGKVGIGTTSPSRRLTIEASADGTNEQLLYLKQTPDNYGWSFNINGSQTGNLHIKNVLNGTENDIMVLNQQGAVGIGGVPVSGIALDVISGHVALDSGYSLYFDGGSDTRMLESSANVLDTYVGGTHSLRLEADGDLQVKQDVVAYSSIYSDERLKDDVKTIDSALEKVKKLRGVEFVWNKGSRKDEKDIGVIAQETEKVLPEIVREKKMGLHTDPDEKFKTVDYDKLTAVLIESIKEQQKQIEELKSEIQELKDGSSK